jgi:hypothetical protein
VAYDPKQRDIRAFFGGNTEISPDSDINAHDTVTKKEDMMIID